MKGPRRYSILFMTILDVTILPMVGFFSNGKNKLIIDAVFNIFAKIPITGGVI